MNRHDIGQRVEASFAVSISELKKNPSAAIAEAQHMAVAVLNHNRVTAYIIKPEVYEYMLECMEDLEDMGKIIDRINEEPIPVDINDL